MKEIAEKTELKGNFKAMVVNKLVDIISAKYVKGLFWCETPQSKVFIQHFLYDQLNPILDPNGSSTSNSSASLHPGLLPSCLPSWCMHQLWQPSMCSPFSNIFMLQVYYHMCQSDTYSIPANLGWDNIFEPHIVYWPRYIMCAQCVWADIYMCPHYKCSSW